MSIYSLDVLLLFGTSLLFHASSNCFFFLRQPTLFTFICIYFLRHLFPGHKFLFIPNCLLRNLYAGQEARVRTGHGTTDWFQIGKGVRQGCILTPCLFNLYAYYIMRNAGLEEENKLESRLPGEITITSDIHMTPSLWQKVKRNSKASWWKWKRRVKKLA